MAQGTSVELGRLWTQRKDAIRIVFASIPA